MISASNISLRYGKRILFDEVNVKFMPGNCYGIIGANGAGKSTFIKILSGEIEPTTGHVDIEKGKRMSVLKQDHFEFDNLQVLETVMMGNKQLFEIIKSNQTRRQASRYATVKLIACDQLLSKLFVIVSQILIKTVLARKLDLDLGNRDSIWAPPSRRERREKRRRSHSNVVSCPSFTSI